MYIVNIRHYNSVAIVKIIYLGRIGPNILSNFDRLHSIKKKNILWRQMLLQMLGK